MEKHTEEVKNKSNIEQDTEKNNEFTESQKSFNFNLNFFGQRPGLNISNMPKRRYNNYPRKYLIRRKVKSPRFHVSCILI